VVKNQGNQPGLLTTLLYPTMAIFPEGRIGTKGFTRITGIGKTRFFQEYRAELVWVQRLDIRPNRRGILSMDEAAVRQLKAQLDAAPVELENRLERLQRPCDSCSETIMRKARTCKHCGERVRE